MTGVLREQAEVNMREKLKTLTMWAQDGIPLRRESNGSVTRDSNGEAVLEYFPSSLAALAAWTPAHNGPYLRPTLHFRQFSRTTLDKTYHGSIRMEFLAAIAAVSLRARKQEKDTNKTSQIDNLRAELAILSKTLEVQDGELLRLRVILIERDKKIQKQSKLIESGAKELQRITSDLEARLADAESRNANLVSALAKLTPLSPRGG